MPTVALQAPGARRQRGPRQMGEPSRRRAPGPLAEERDQGRLGRRTHRRVHAAGLREVVDARPLRVSELRTSAALYAVEA